MTESLPLVLSSRYCIINCSGHQFSVLPTLSIKKLKVAEVRPNCTKLDELDRVRQNWTKLDKIGPNQTKLKKIGPNGIELDQSAQI